MYIKLTTILFLLTINIFSSGKLEIKSSNFHTYKGMDEKIKTYSFKSKFKSSENINILSNINFNDKFTEMKLEGNYKISKSKFLVHLNSDYSFYSGNSTVFNKLRNTISTGINVNYKHSKYFYTFLNNKISYDQNSLGYNGNLGLKVYPFSCLSFKTDLNWVMYENLSFVPYNLNFISEISFDFTPVLDTMVTAVAYVALFPIVIILEALTGNSMFDKPATGIVYLNTDVGFSYYFNKSKINPQKISSKLSTSLNLYF